MGSYRSDGLSWDWHVITGTTVHSVVCSCWQALADLSMGKKKVMVPYRDSVLTKLLQNALGGNRWVMDSQFWCWLHGGECKTALTVLNELGHRRSQGWRLGWDVLEWQERVEISSSVLNLPTLVCLAFNLLLWWPQLMDVSLEWNGHVVIFVLFCWELQMFIICRCVY